MSTASIRSFWSHPIAATRAYLTTRMPLQAVELTFILTVTLYYLYFWNRNDQFSMQLANGFSMCGIGVLSLWRIRAERLQISIAVGWMNVLLGIFMVWLALRFVPR